MWTADGEVIGTGASVFYGPAEVGTHTLTVTVSDGNQTVTHTWTVVNEPMIGTPTTPLLWWVPALIVGIAVLVALAILLVLVFGRRRRPPPEAVFMPPMAFPPPPFSMPPPDMPPARPPPPGREEPPAW